MGEKLKAITRNLKYELTVCKLLATDSRTPKTAKIVLGLALGYVFLPFDVIPDFIPVLGQADDLVIVPSLILLALKLIPAELVEECRLRALEPAKN